MYLTEVRAEHFGPLRHQAFERLSPRMTVLFGPEGAGKTAFVHLIRSVFFGFRRSVYSGHADRLADSGSVSLQTAAGTRTLRRYWTVNGTEQLTARDQTALRSGDDYVISHRDNSLPGWITEDVFREVYSAGPDDAERLELLSRLCLESGFERRAADAELRQAEAAQQHAVRDRDGNGIQGGVVHRISELRRRQGDLLSEIAQLRRPSVDSARIEQLVVDIETHTAAISRISDRLREIDAEISRVEKLIAESHRRHALPLNRPELEEEIRELSARLERWRGIKQQISREVEIRTVATDTVLQPEDGLRSVRAIISRLEERIQALTDRGRSAGLVERELLREGELAGLLRTEVAALCQYFGQHEQENERYHESIAAHVAERSLSDAAQMVRLLEGRLAAVRAELQRADNVIAEGVIPKLNETCLFSGHHELVHHGPLLSAGRRTFEDLEVQLQQLKSERARQVSERSAQEKERLTKVSILERLRQEVGTAGTLEQLDQLRARVAELDAEIVLLEDQRRQLDRLEVSLRELVERLKGRTFSHLFELATQYAKRMTNGECQQIQAGGANQISVRLDHSADVASLYQIPAGTRELISLALRLALVQLRRESHGHVPLILDDILRNADLRRVQATVQLLSEISAQGQQILLFTDSAAVRDESARNHADIRSILARVEAPPIPAAPVPVPVPAPVVLQAWVEPRVEVRPAVAEPIVVQQPAQQVIVEPAQLPGATNWLFYLEVDHGVEDLAGITLGELEALRSAGILTVDDLLTKTVPQLEEAVRHKGFLLSVDRLQGLRGQAELAVRVPMLRRGDAALLYAAGIHSAEELSRLRPETVYDRVTAFQRSDAGSRYRRAGRLIDRQQSINWARFGQCARTLEEARTSRSRFSVRATPRSLVSTDVGRGGVVRSAVAAPEPAGKRLRKRRISEEADNDDRRARRQARRRRQVSRLRSDDSPSDGTDEGFPVERSGGMRFFLSRTSEVEKAPSIGPRTAQMLETIGVRTVEDLLSIPADRLSEKLSHRRMTPAVIQQWQDQARLICQVPELRGHDAQILVACGITTPEALAARKPAELFAIVDPFAGSREGERILRNGHRPDLAEVTDWIQWAANARAFRAA